MSLSVSLDTGVTALRAAQAEVDTAAHNIANVNTPGYSRQQVMLEDVAPARHTLLAAGAVQFQIGQGVNVSGIRRVRNEAIDGQYRLTRATNDELQARLSALQQSEAVLQEPSDQALSAQLDNFFNAFRDLAGRPESAAARTAAISQSQTLATTFQNAAQGLNAQRGDLDHAAGLDVQQIDAKASELATLNQQISSATLAGDPANDLHDQRDQILDDLSGLAGVTVQQNSDDTVSVLVGGRALVDKTSVDALKFVPDAGNNNLGKVEFSSDGATAAVSGGELHGLLDARDNRIPALLSTLNQAAGALITAVNAHHQAGFGLNGATGLPLFTGTDATTIAVNPTLVADPTNLATAGAANEPGNGDTATAIAGVQNEQVLNGNTATVTDVYHALVTGLGSDASQAKSLADNQSAVLQQLESARQSVSGVSTDEEMANLLSGQHAYSAAARIITTVQTMLDDLVNMVHG